MSESSNSVSSSPAGRARSRPFALDMEILSPWLRGLFQMVRRPLEALLSLSKLQSWYDASSDPSDPVRFLNRALEVAGVRTVIPPEDLSRIPKAGPIVVSCNHPFGGIEGIVLGKILTDVRPDVQIMANYLLGRMAELQQVMILVDPFEREDSASRNLNAMREAIRWLRGGGCLGVFPSGEVSSFQWKQRGVADRPWNDSFVRLARRTQATVVPMYFPGRNSLTFNFMGMLHPSFRTALLPKELWKKRHSTIEARVGQPVTAERLADFPSDREASEYLRLRTYMLAEEQKQTRRVFWFLPAHGMVDKPPATPQPIVTAQDVERLTAEVERLPKDRVLVQQGRNQVILVQADEAPLVLQEIGRLREVTFRVVGEGTGQASDLDRFDDTYHHLFVWDAESRQVVGAYRLGLTDHILPKLGKRGLYVTTLFKIKRKLLDEINPAIELGRSWVRTDHQKSYSALMLLWKGIGQFIARNPQYCNLFGPVSISAEYRSVSRTLLQVFLRENHHLPRLCKGVKPRKPARQHLKGVDSRLATRVVRDLDDVDRILREVEDDEKGVPILVRQYLKLGGRLLGFNVDPLFGSVLDGLILVDLRQTDPRTLRKYMGAGPAAAFMNRHHIPDRQPTPARESGEAKM